MVTGNDNSNNSNSNSNSNKNIIIIINIISNKILFTERDTERGTELTKEELRADPDVSLSVGG